MVDALQAAHRVLRTGGMLVDARPDRRRLPRLIAGGRVLGLATQHPATDEDDGAADAAVETVLGRGLFRRLRAGHLWHGTTFRDLAELNEYCGGSARYAPLAREVRARLRPHRAGPIIMRRSIAWQVLERLSPSRSRSPSSS